MSAKHGRSNRARARQIAVTKGLPRHAFIVIKDARVAYRCERAIYLALKRGRPPAGLSPMQLKVAGL
jgi:hypothetical protein